jgi:hypothetical protein
MECFFSKNWKMINYESDDSEVLWIAVEGQGVTGGARFEESDGTRKVLATFGERPV